MNQLIPLKGNCTFWLQKHPFLSRMSKIKSFVAPIVADIFNFDHGSPLVICN